VLTDDIGDLINVEPSDTPGKPDGSAAWIVKDVSLFTTTVLYSFTVRDELTFENWTQSRC